MFGDLQNFQVSAEEKLADSLFKFNSELKDVNERLLSARKLLEKKDLTGTYYNYEYSAMIPNYKFGRIMNQNKSLCQKPNGYNMNLRSSVDYRHPPSHNPAV